MGDPAGAGRAQKPVPGKIIKDSSVGSDCRGSADRGVSLLSDVGRVALIRAKQNTKTPTVIEFIIDREINVMPIVPPGNSLNDMIK